MNFSKQLIRKENIKKRWNLSTKDKLKFDHLIFKKLKNACLQLPKDKYISIYWSVENEVDTIGIIDWLLNNNFKVCLPYIMNKKNMVMKPIEKLNFEYDICFNIRQPKTKLIINPKSISAFIIPIVAYDNSNNRIGYGLGYYDRYLSKANAINSNTYKYGLAYSFQNIDKITPDIYDVKLDKIFTE